MILKKITSILLLIAIPCLGQNKTALSKALNSIEPKRIEAAMKFLANDSLEGRQPGSKGFSLATKYIENELKTIGLKPGINNTNYIQRVPLLKGLVNNSESSFVLKTEGKEEILSPKIDFRFIPNLSEDISEINAPLVFVGYGVSAPELGYDDYKNIDTKDKIVVVCTQTPSKFEDIEKAYFSSADAKFKTAIDHGAVGILLIEMKNITQEVWDERTRNSEKGTFKWLDKANKPNNAYGNLKAIAVLNNVTADKLFSVSGKKSQDIFDLLKSGIPQSFPLAAEAKIKVVTKRTSVESSNVIGIIPGSDSVLKEEYLVYAAHYDHFGIGATVHGDSIYNGAHDNASGVAILLEIARTFSKLPIKPKRSILFAFVTAEELGLLGSDYFVSNPTVKGSIIANMSLDMPFFFHPVLDIVPYGAQHSSLNNHVQAAAKTLHLKISPDPFPEQVVFTRSDHFSFIKKGIPALFIKSGFMTIETDTVDRAIADKEWRKTTYHTPQDDMTQAFDFNAAATHVKINFIIGLLTANDINRPNWNKGDFFGGKFGKK